MDPGAAAPSVLGWLDTHAGAMQAILAFVLTVITARYAWLTKKLLGQAEASSRAAERSAAANENTISFMRQQHEEQLGQGPQIVREEIKRAKGLIISWQSAVQARSFVMGDAASLSAFTLREALPHARRISVRCADLLIEAENAILLAHTDMKTLREASRVQFVSSMTIHAHRAIERLSSAMSLLQSAEELLSNADK